MLPLFFSPESSNHELFSLYPRIFQSFVDARKHFDKFLCLVLFVSRVRKTTVCCVVRSAACFIGLFFQLIDFRINRALFLPKQTVAKKAKVPKERDLVVKEIVAKIRSLGAVTAEVAACGFQLVLRLKELADVAQIRRILESPEHQTKTCTFSEGFFREGTMEAVRLALSRAILREDPALAGSNAGLVRQFQRVGLFKGVVLAAKSGEEEEENDWENEGEEDGRLSTADGDAEMEDRTGPLGADGEAVDVEMDLEDEEMGEEEE